MARTNRPARATLPFAIRAVSTADRASSWLSAGLLLTTETASPDNNSTLRSDGPAISAKWAACRGVRTPCCTAANASSAGTFCPRLLIEESVKGATPLRAEPKVVFFPLCRPRRLDSARETALPTLEIFPGEAPAILHHHHKVFRGRADLAEMLRQKL